MMKDGQTVKFGETKNTGKSGNKGVGPSGATQVFPLSSFCLGLAREIGFHPGVSLVNPGDASNYCPSPVGHTWSTRTPLGRLG